RSDAHHHAYAGGDGELGLARAVAHRLRDYSVSLPAAPLTRGDRRVPRSIETAAGIRSLSIARDELAADPRGHVDGHDDDGVVLHDYRVHANVRQRRAAPDER